jgi:hypothetical protein
MMRQSLRYVAAVIFAPIIGELIGLPFAVAIDALWGDLVTGARWPFTIPNVILTVIKGLIVGFSAGWIAGRRGKLMAGVAVFLPLTIIVAISLAMNRDLLGPLQSEWDTKPSLWAWIEFVPALLAGHFAVKYKNLGLGPFIVGAAAGMFVVAQIGATAFHFYTSIIAYQIAGTGAAVAAFVFPVFSELWWFWKVWGLAGSIWNAYTSRLLLLALWALIALMLAAFGSYLTEKAERRRRVAVDDAQ